MKTTHLAVERTDQHPVQPEEADQDKSDGIQGDEHGEVAANGRQAGRDPESHAHADNPAGPLPSSNRRSARLTSRSMASELDSAHPGSARMTRREPGASWSRWAATTWRSWRATRCRVTAFPTALETMNPTRTSATSWASAGATSRDRCATTRPPGARRPRRTVASKSRERVMRAAAGSTTSRVRLPVCRGPCRGERTRSTGRRAYACAGGTRASCDAGGCWAGRCASLEDSVSCGSWCRIGRSRGWIQLHVVPSVANDDIEAATSRSRRKSVDGG